MNEAVAAYQSVAHSTEFQQIERLRERTRQNEASAIEYAREEGAETAIAGILKRMKDANLSPDLIESILKGGA
jgi:hypothetical protein